MAGYIINGLTMTKRGRNATLEIISYPPTLYRGLSFITLFTQITQPTHFTQPTHITQKEGILSNLSKKSRVSMYEGGVCSRFVMVIEVIFRPKSKIKGARA